jgi:ribokinase
MFTALGDDEAGRRSHAELELQGVCVVAAVREQPTRQAVSLIDATCERTTITLGDRLQPASTDHLPWDELKTFDAVYFTAGDAPLLRRARTAQRLVVTCRELDTAAAANVALDGLVGSGRDPAERYRPAVLGRPPALLVTTFGADGGRFSVRGGGERSYQAVNPPGPVVDSYGVGDSFAGALTFGFAKGLDPEDTLSLAAQCGAACASVRGPFALRSMPRTSQPTAMSMTAH